MLPNEQGSAKTQINPYERHPGSIRNPPQDLTATVRYLGPGLILAGAIVGSGELIATTTLGAKTGFLAMWLILVSCLIKVVIQIEIGRYTISSGDTTMQAFNRIPGPRRRVSWLMLLYLVRYPFWVIMGGGIVGGLGQCLALAFPVFRASVWMVVAACAGIVLLLSGKYRSVQGFSTVMVGCFTFVTLASVVMVEWTPYAFSVADLISGLTFRLPAGGAMTALAVLGITGLSAGELIAYPYWCVERGMHAIQEYGMRQSNGGNEPGGG